MRQHSHTLPSILILNPSIAAPDCTRVLMDVGNIAAGGDAGGADKEL